MDILMSLDRLPGLVYGIIANTDPDGKIFLAERLDLDGLNPRRSAFYDMVQAGIAGVNPINSRG